MLSKWRRLTNSIIIIETINVVIGLILIKIGRVGKLTGKRVTQLSCGKLSMGCGATECQDVAV